MVMEFGVKKRLNVSHSRKRFCEFFGKIKMFGNFKVNANFYWTFDSLTWRIIMSRCVRTFWDSKVDSGKDFKIVFILIFILKIIIIAINCENKNTPQSLMRTVNETHNHWDVTLQLFSHHDPIVHICLAFCGKIKVEICSNWRWSADVVVETWTKSSKKEEYLTFLLTMWNNERQS